MDVLIWSPRILETADYETLVEWWKYWRFPAPSIAFLPDEGTCGIMLEDSNGKQYCAGFIYFTNSGACWMEYIVSSPEIRDKELRKSMLGELIKQLSYFAKENGANWIFTSVKNNSLIDRYLEGGFLKGSTGTTEMIKLL
jgi:hypothetical protein